MYWQRRNRRSHEIDPDEIFLDSQNLPQFDTNQFEGQIERPISKYAVGVLGGACLVLFALLFLNIGFLQVVHGATYRDRSETNGLQQIPFFGDRGIIYDRNNVPLAWNDPDRSYVAAPGSAHVLGYVAYPTDKDVKAGNLHSEELIGKTGAEAEFDETLRGKSGVKIIETDASGNITSESVYEPPKSGDSVTLSIDSRLQAKLYSTIQGVAEDRGFSGGSGVIMDIKTGEILALTNYPEYSPQELSGADRGTAFAKYLNDSRAPFLNRATGGVYTPGSVIKPYIAMAALEEHVIDPATKILSTGSISIPNPYDPKQSTVFKDWRAQGYVNMREAISVSSDVYFYEIGGGYKDQKGLGIRNIQKYAQMFGFGSSTGINLESDAEGVVPSPEWKAENFDGEAWFLGNTYHTSIGQYGFGVTPIQMVRAMSAIANEGTLLTPTITKTDTPKVASVLPFPKSYFDIVHEGMRMSATTGTGAGLNIPGFAVGAKTGTAELGVSKARVNSWVTGFFPYDNPRYAFAVVMEKGALHNTIGGVFVMRQMFEWMLQNTPEYTILTPKL